MRKIFLALVVALALAGCGKSDIVAVKQPLLPIYVCSGLGYRSQRCAQKFNAGLLIGLRLSRAERLAKTHGYVVQREAPVAGGFMSGLMYLSNRIDVECNDTSRDCVVVRIIGKG
jgi:hypothetical protein